MKTQYKFIVPHQKFKVGDLVPDGYTDGVISTMLTYRRIAPVAPKPYAPVEDPTMAKAVECAPADKMQRAGGVKRKGVA